MKLVFSKLMNLTYDIAICLEVKRGLLLTSLLLYCLSNKLSRINHIISDEIYFALVSIKLMSSLLRLTHYLYDFGLAYIDNCITELFNI